MVPGGPAWAAHPSWRGDARRGAPGAAFGGLTEKAFEDLWGGAPRPAVAVPHVPHAERREPKE
eukprot:48439-Alexandrium_andersonii.AAC.1